jgi:hypothetical protein
MSENLLFCCVQGDPTFLIFNEIRGAANRCGLPQTSRDAEKVSGGVTLTIAVLGQSRCR